MIANCLNLPWICWFVLQVICFSLFFSLFSLFSFLFLSGCGDSNSLQGGWHHPQRYQGQQNYEMFHYVWKCFAMACTFLSKKNSLFDHYPWPCAWTERTFWQILSHFCKTGILETVLLAKNCTIRQRSNIIHSKLTFLQQAHIVKELIW